MVRIQGSSRKNCSKLGHLKYQENDLEMSTSKMGNIVGKTMKSHLKQYGLLQNLTQNDVDQRHPLEFMVP
jgi:hypothetical protein